MKNRQDICNEVMASLLTNSIVALLGFQSVDDEEGRNRIYKGCYDNIVELPGLLGGSIGVRLAHLFIAKIDALVLSSKGPEEFSQKLFELVQEELGRYLDGKEDDHEEIENIRKETTSHMLSILGKDSKSIN